MSIRDPPKRIQVYAMQTWYVAMRQWAQHKSDGKTELLTSTEIETWLGMHLSADYQPTILMWDISSWILSEVTSGL